MDTFGCVCPGYVRTNVYRIAEVVDVTLPADVSRDKLTDAGQDDRAITGGSGDPRRRGAQQGADRLPARVRWLRRVNQLFPGLIERGLLRQFRQRQQRVRAAGIVAREPDIASAPRVPHGTAARQPR